MPRYGLVATAGNMAEILRDYNVGYDQRRTWDQIHLQTQQQHAAGTGMISQQLAGSLEQAYSSHVAQQSAIAGTRLGQGQKNLLSEQLYRATEQAYQTASQAAAGYQSQLDEAIAKQAAGIEGALMQEGQFYADIINKTPDFFLSQIEDNPELVNDPQWARYFVEMGLENLTPEERERYDELKRENAGKIALAKENLVTLGETFKSEYGLADKAAVEEELARLDPNSEGYDDYVASVYAEEYERITSDPRAMQAIAAGRGKGPGTSLGEKVGHAVRQRTEGRRAELQKLYDQYELLELQSSEDAMLLEDKKKSKSLEDFTTLHEKTKEKRAMTREELAASLYDYDEAEGFKFNLAGQSLFKQAFADQAYGQWLHGEDEDLYNWFVSQNEFDYRGASQNLVRDMLGIGPNEYQYKFLEDMGGMSEEQIRDTFDVFDTSATNIALGNYTPDDINKLAGNVTTLLEQLGIDADFKEETGIDMSELATGIDKVIGEIVSGKDINAAAAGTIFAGIAGGAAAGTAIAGWTGVGGVVGAIVGGLFGMIQGSISAHKSTLSAKENNKRIKLMVQREYSNMLDELAAYMSTRTQEAEERFEKSIRRL